MPHYLGRFSYTTDAIRALVDDPQDRGAAAREAFESLGGTLLGYWFCFGEFDGVHRRAPRQRDGGRGRDGGGPDRNAVEGRDDRADRDGGGAGGDAQGRRGDVPATRRLTHAPTAQAWSGAPKRSRRAASTSRSASRRRRST